jgi:hypothetical protein
MYSVEADRSKRLIVFTAAGRVTAQEVAKVREELRTLLTEIAPEAAVLSDLRFVETMKPEVARHIGEIMDLLAEHKVAAVVRVIPNAKKDVGMMILSRLHYGADVQVFTVPTLAEAIAILAESEPD